MQLPTIPTPPEISSEEKVHSVLTTIVRYQWGVIGDWEPIARTGEHIEGVHKVRVGFRRLRSALVVFRPATNRDWSREMVREMKWTAGGLGAARDLDVFLDEGLPSGPDELAARPGGEAFLQLARLDRRRAYEQVRQTLESRRYADLKDSIETWLTIQETATHAEEPILPFAVKSLDKRHERLLKAGKKFEKLSDHDLHGLRIHGKKLRYATDFFRSLFPRQEGDTFIRALKELQDGLGLLNDVAVLPQLMRGILACEHEAQVKSLAQEILEHRREQARRQHARLPKLWDDFRSLPAPWR